MSIFLNDNFSTEFPKPLDNRYGPFDDVASALAFLEPYKRYIGLTVGIGTSTIIEYWFDGGILDANFIVKSDHSVVDWGDIGGTLSNQTDLQTALNLKLDASIVSGGLTGQILAKDSDADYDVSWIDNYTEDIRDTVKATEPINKGQAVYISGANGTNQLATKADYSGEQTSSQTIGLAYQNFVTNQIGQIITQGLLTGIDTSGANAAGDPVYLGANGNLIYGYANKPKAPYHLVYIGIVTRKNANNGEIYVKIQNGYELEELHNVAITSPTNNQGIFYNSTNGLWENKSIVTALGYTPVSESGSYSNPSWITDLAFSKITGYSVPTLAQVTTAGATTTNFITVGGLTSNGSVTASAALARGNYINNTLVASANNDVLVGLDIAPTFTNTGFSNVSSFSIRTWGQMLIGTSSGDGKLLIQASNSSEWFSVGVASPGVIAFNRAGGYTLAATAVNLARFNIGSLSAASNVLSLQGVSGQTGDLLRVDATNATTTGNTFLIKSTGNILVNTTTDAGFRLDVNGTARIQNQLTTTGSITAASAIARGVYFNQTLTAAANNDVLSALDINPTYTLGSFTGVTKYGIRLLNPTAASVGSYIDSPIFLMQGSIWNSAVGARNMTATMVVTPATYPSTGVNKNPSIAKLSFGLASDSGTPTEVMFVNSDGKFGVNGGFIGNAPNTNNAYNVTLDNNGTATYGGVTFNSNKVVLKGRAWNPAEASVPNIGYMMMSNIQNNTNPTIDKLSFFVGSASSSNSGDTNGNAKEILALRTDGAISTINTSGTETMRIFNSGNLLLQNGGTFTDAGYRLDVNGSTRLNGALTLGMTPIVAASVVSTHKLRITIAGTTYYLLATNV